MKLSAEDKDLRKLARKARDRAYNARYRLLREAQKKKEAALEAEFGAQLSSARANERAVHLSHSAADAEFARQIADIQAKREAAQAIGRDERQAAHAIVREIWDRRGEVEKRMDDEIGEQFLDLCGSALWSAAAWKPIEEFLSTGDSDANLAALDVP